MIINKTVKPIISLFIQCRRKW